MANVASPPIRDSLIELDETRPARRDPYYIARSWILWLQQTLVERTQAAPEILQTVTLTDQSASIAATAMPLASVTAGRYRFQYYARITTVGSVSSSLTVTMGWTEGGISLSLSGAAMTGNTTSTVQSGSALLQVDANSPLTYSTTYASNAAGEMRYRLTVMLESL